MMNSEDGFLGPVNIGNPNEFTMLELAEAVIALTESKSKNLICLYHKTIPNNVSPILL
jgi:nucleoside-diphosphate-sugar epimerase